MASLFEYDEDDFLALSGIQHYEFCQRQWALIHIEQQWQENVLTLQGQIMHENVHNIFKDYRRKTKFYSCGVAVHSRRLGIYGVCDLVEFEDSQILPVEYKRGKPKEHNADVLQLVLQAICLEEMLCANIDLGYIYYGEIKHRIQVEITTDLKNLAAEKVEAMHRLYQRKHTSKPKKAKYCNSCSLKELCLPQLEKAPSGQIYIQKRLKEVADEEAT